MFNSKYSSTCLFASLVVLVSFAHPAFADPITEAQRRTVAYSLEKSTQSRVSLESAIAELQSTAQYNKASLTEVKVLGMVDRILVLFRSIREILTPELKENIQKALEKAFNVQLSEDPYLKNAEQLEQIISQLNELVSVEKEIQSLADEILASGDDKNMKAFEAKMDSAAEAMNKVTALFAEFRKASGMAD